MSELQEVLFNHAPQMVVVDIIINMKNEIEQTEQEGILRAEKYRLITERWRLRAKHLLNK